jgi:hypothetical protein
MVDSHNSTSNKMNNNNDSSEMSTNNISIVAHDEEEVVVLTDKPEAKMPEAKMPTQWPQLKVLCRDQKDVVLMILKAIDECDCTSELHANNSGDAKGNKWVKLWDNFWAEGSPGRGLLAGHLPMLPSSSKTKLKMVALWQYLKKTASVGSEQYEKAVRQEMEYENTKANDKAATDKQKANDAELREKMLTYEKGTGAWPPGAKGLEGTGRAGHSTNLMAGEPAPYSYRNMTTRPDGKDVIDILEDDEPKAKKVKKAKVSVSAATVNDGATSELKVLGDTMQQAYMQLLGPKDGSGNGKRKRLEMKLDSLKKQMLTYKEFADDEHFQNMLAKTKKKYMAIATELNALDSDGED